MRNYDVSLVFSPLLTDQEVNDTLQQLASFVQEKGGILGDQQLKGKRPLLAPIGKHREGYLSAFSFSLSPEHLGDFEKKGKEENTILRFLIAKQPRKGRKAEPGFRHRTLSSPALADASSKEATSPATATLATGTGKEEKVDLKDIDEKLEEIFKET